MNEDNTPNYSRGRATVICPNCGAENEPRSNFCARCGAKIPNGRCHCPDCGRTYADDIAYCTNCGAKTVPGDPPQRNQEYYGTYEYRENINRRQPTSEKDWLVALLLCIIVGTLGVHRFYVGKIGTGILWLLTFGCFFVGWIVDIVMIASGSFTDADGLPLKNIR